MVDMSVAAMSAVHSLLITASEERPWPVPKPSQPTPGLLSPESARADALELLRSISPGRAATGTLLGVPPELLYDAHEVSLHNAHRGHREFRGSIQSRPGDVVRIQIKELRLPTAEDTHIVVRWNADEIARTPVATAGQSIFHFGFSLKLNDGDGELAFEAMRGDRRAGVFVMPLTVVLPGETRDLWFRLRSPDGPESDGAALLRIEHRRERMRLGRGSPVVALAVPRLDSPPPKAFNKRRHTLAGTEAAKEGRPAPAGPPRAFSAPAALGPEPPVRQMAAAVLVALVSLNAAVWAPSELDGSPLRPLAALCSLALAAIVCGVAFRARRIPA